MQLQSTTTKPTDELFLEIVYIFILPVVLIYLGVISVEARVLVLFVCALLISGIIRHQRWSKEKLGMVPVTRRSLTLYGAFTAAGIAALIYYASVLGFEPLNIADWSASWRLILFFIPLSVLQEIAYRGFLSARLKELFTSRMHRVLINTGLFTLLHIIYPLPLLMLPVVLIGGFFFAYIYDKYPNLLLVCISHALLNFTAVLFGFFVI